MKKYDPVEWSKPKYKPVVVIAAWIGTLLGLSIMLLLLFLTTAGIMWAWKYISGGL